MRILLVDDEIELTDSLCIALTREGYEVDTAQDGAVGAELTRQGSYDLLILDWMLPQQSGLEICQWLRAQGETTPVLFLTAKDTIDDRVQGLDAGADDYLVKPFELRELLARVRALLRRPANQPIATAPQSLMPASATANPLARLRVADLELDPANQLAYRQGQTIDLSEKECLLLAYFMRHPGQVLTHAQIHQYLWQGDEQPASNALAAQIKLLRRKIELPGESALIHTVYGRGYRFGTITP
jgi:OmpR-family two-component system manganese-sensing response regulator